MTIREALENLLAQALEQAVAEGSLALEQIPVPTLERPREEGHGDWACTVAMRLAKQAKMNPRQIAQIVVDAIPDNTLVSSVEIAGPGFMNFTLTDATFQHTVMEVREAGESFGSSVQPDPARINIEYVSANPTGPMHVGHGRWAALGDSIARLLRHVGFQVDEEFYINDQGNQMNVFAQSIAVRYQQHFGQDVEMPENCYGGGYVAELARRIAEADGDKWLFVDPEERLLAFRDMGYQAMLASVKETLVLFGNDFDTWFSEHSLYVPVESGSTQVDRAFKELEAKGCIYQKDSATFFRASDFGDEKDRVLIKGDGDVTYFMSDIAYHYNKMARGYDHLIDVWGADHHGYIPRCRAMMEAAGFEGEPEVVLGQLVTLFRDGQQVRMSKRTGEMVTFRELIDEVGVDSTRYMMLSKSADQSIDFDIEAAKKKDASNPVYYVQYAHARICSILRKAAAAGSLADQAEGMGSNALAQALMLDEADLSLLTEPSELALMKKMAGFTDFVAAAARDRAPYRITHFVQDLASLFHSFYTQCHVMVDDEDLMRARLALCDAVRINVAVGLGLLGVSAPERM